jgi:hypothetical protein
MKRIAVIGITVAATVAVMLGAVRLAFKPDTELIGDSVMLLSRDQATECANGGGCAILSLRQIMSLSEKKGTGI